MELIGGLAFIGSYLNDRENKKVLDDNKSNLKIEECDNCDIYSRTMFTKANDLHGSLLSQREKESKSSNETGMYPSGNGNNREFFDNDCHINSDSDMSSRGNTSIDMNDPLYFINKGGGMTNNRKHEKRHVKQQRGNYESQFEDLTFDNPNEPVSINAAPYNNSRIARMENERDLALSGGFSNFDEQSDMTYGITNRENFTHNNMKPYFKKSPNPSSLEHVSRVSQQKMELFSGAERTGWEKKKEQDNLFDPVTNMTNIYGNPSMSSMIDYESRYIPSKERRNEKPFEQIKVAPGLGLGAKGGGNYTSGGGDMYRVLPKTVDDLRTIPNRKETYETVTNVGQKGSNGPIAGKSVKRGPDKFKENNTKDFLKTYSYIQAPKLVGEIDPATLGRNRGLKETEHYGAMQAVHTKDTPDELRGKHKEASKKSFKQADPRNVHLIDGLRGRSVTFDETFVPDATQRGKDNNYLGPGQSYTNKSYIYDKNDIRDATKRDQHNQYDRSGKAMTGNTHMGKSFDPNEVMDATKRDQHNQYDRSGKAMTGNTHMGKLFDPNEVMDATKRDQHNQYDRSGKAMTGNTNMGKLFNPNETPDITKRDQHNQYDRSGKAMTGNTHMGKIFDPNETPDITKRDQHNKYDRSGKAVSGNSYKSMSFNPDEVPDATKRDQHNKYDRSGKAVSGNSYKSMSFNPDEVPDATKRDQHNKYDRSGKAVSGNSYRSMSFNPDEVPDATKRDQHNKYDRSGKAVSGNSYRSMSFNPDEVPDATKRDQHNQYDRSGKAMSGNMHKGMSFNPDEVPDATKRDQHNQYDRSGKAVSGNSYRSVSFNPNDVQDLTKRNTYNYDEVANVTGNKMSVKYIDYNDVPDVTNREITGETNHVGAGNHEVNNSYVINYDNAVPDITNRETTGETNRTNPGNFGIGREKTREDVYNMNVNTSKEKTLKNRTPTTISYNKGPTNNFTEYELKDRQQLDREYAPSLIGQSVRLPQNVSKNRNDSYFLNERLDQFTKENLNGNPFINNIMHKSITYN
jgi:hypothetical protein